ncbi:MAG TPA: DUF177 domain-containing protein [Candidatus Acidoferrales bacterium]|nr:DUF177 domain-containing protein [Candidatus Acidoferrales bacterium]
MKLLIDQVDESPKTMSFTESVDELNQFYGAREGRDFRFPRAVDVDLVFYRSGREILLRGSFRGIVKGECGRCLEDYTFRIDSSFDLVLLPARAEKEKTRELTQDEMSVSFYQGAEINLAPLIQEQVLLALPIRPLCDESCRGLCVGCGINLNEASCRCQPTGADERMAVFRSLRVGR